jgi:zinc/manganese transport system ATP-binding protein
MADLQLENLTCGYGRRPAVHHVTAQIPAGGLTALVGPNGAGKSTLLKALAGRLKPFSGAVGWPAGVKAAETAYMAQAASIDTSAPVDVSMLVAAGLWRRRGLMGGLRPQDRARIGDAIATVGLAGFEQRPLRTLSGGQLQRALFARVMVQDCPVILLDEPFAAVDTRTSQRLLDLAAAWAQEGRTVVVSLHDLDLVRARFDHVLLLARELVAAGRPAAALSSENLLRARRMSESWREHAEACHADIDAA